MIYINEIKKAVDWLFCTQNKESFGWSWVRDISPNSQNTAEVVYSVSYYAELLSDNQKALINEAVEQWLLIPQKRAAITHDWIWIGLALNEYLHKLSDFNPEFDAEYIEKGIVTCVNNLLSLQNDDGGWADHKGDISTTCKTAMVIFFLGKQHQVNIDEYRRQIDNAAKWLTSTQNEDGGFGNVKSESMTNENLLDFNDMDYSTVSAQYQSSIAASGYALLALSSYNKHYYCKAIKRVINYLKAKQKSGDQDEIFYEVGIRKNTPFTFRHFSAVWMGLGLFTSNQFSFNSPEIISIIKYLLSLQDEASGGFKCSSASDVYTWSDCNALMFFSFVQESLKKISGFDVTDIITDYISHDKGKIFVTLRNPWFYFSLFFALLSLVLIFFQLM